jgi:hypothetical protein
MGAGIGIMISPLKTGQLKDYELQSKKKGAAARLSGFSPHLTLTTTVTSAI